MHKEGKVKKSLDYRLFDQAIKQSEDQVGHLLVMGCKVHSFSLGKSPSSDGQEALRFASHKVTLVKVSMLTKKFFAMISSLPNAIVIARVPLLSSCNVSNAVLVRPQVVS